MKMSHQLIKRITFKNDGVYFSAASNNVTPKNYTSEKSRYHSELLNNKGKIEVDKIILWDFVTGGFKANGDNSRVRLYQDVAYKIKKLDEYNRLDNIYWGWDNVKRTLEEREQAKNDICNILYDEYQKAIQ
jgi:hypothetical protein